MKIIALDIGDKWTGIAISDPLGIFARPYDTAKSNELISFLNIIIAKENISFIVIGLPTTLMGRESDQTKKVIALSKDLENTYPNITIKLWDERFTSKQAAIIKPTKNKADKLKSHAVAAALILSTYLEFRRINEPSNNNFY